MKEVILVGLMILFSVMSIIFLGSGITGMAVFDVDEKQTEYASASIYIGLIMLMALLTVTVSFVHSIMLKRSRKKFDEFLE